MEVDEAFGLQRRPASFSFGRRLAEAANAVGKATLSVGTVITRTAASAGELLVDSELRWKGTSKFLTEASKGVQTIQKGLGEVPGRIGQRLQQGVQHGIKAGGRPVQIVQRVIAKQIAELQRYNQLAQDGQPLVDIQIGPQVYEEMPQEMRSRLWYVILEHEELLEPLRPLHRPNTQPDARFSQTCLFDKSTDLIRSSSPAGTSTRPSPLGLSSIQTNVTDPSTPQSRTPQRRTTNPDSNGIELSTFTTSTPDPPSSPIAPMGTPFASPPPIWSSTPTNPPQSTAALPIPHGGGSTPSQKYSRNPLISSTQNNRPTAEADLIDLDSPQRVFEHPLFHPYVSTTPPTPGLGDLINLESPKPHTESSSLALRQSGADSAVLLGSPILPPCTPSQQDRDSATGPHRDNVRSSNGHGFTPGKEHDSVNAEYGGRGHWGDAQGSEGFGSFRPLGTGQAETGPAGIGQVETVVEQLGPVQVISEAGPSGLGFQSMGDNVLGLGSLLLGDLLVSSADLETVRNDSVVQHPLTLWDDRVVQSGSHESPQNEIQQHERLEIEHPQQPPQFGQSGRLPTELLEWEVVPSSDGKFEDGMQQSELARSCIRRISANGDEGTRKALGELKEAMSFVPWPIPTTFEADCKFATLNSITLGQEEVDEVINRDINRTFPEHPYFGERAGQMCLFRILKAYSLHDLEVGYCQGMAFVAGILLMYLPEEPAFRLFCRLMSEDGPDMRRLYLPGLEPLKIELARLEYLLSQHMPDLFAHLREYGIPAVLYASQWLLTGYSCPFPHTFAARVLDIMLQDNDDKILQRLALAIMKECRKDLLELDDFEAIITCLKVTPLKWPQHQLRKVLNNALCSQVSDAELQESLEVAIVETRKIAREASVRHRRTTSVQPLPSNLQAHESASNLAHPLTLQFPTSSPSVTAVPIPTLPPAIGSTTPSLLAFPGEEGEEFLEETPLEEQFLNMIFMPESLDSVDLEADGTIDAVFGR